MQRILNDPDDVVDEMLKGFVKVHCDIVTTTDNPRVLKRKDIPAGKVGVVTGGGSGHKPAFVGYIGENRPGGRTCDRMARALLGRRGSTVHNAPSRASLEHGIVSGEDHLDAVTNVLLRRYREVAAEMAPYRQRTVYEVHPELSFFQINGDVPLRWSKKFEAGWEERNALLRKRIPGVERILEEEIDDVPVSHLLDVAAMLWTARRIFARAGTRLPTDPEWDEQGLRMEFVR